MRQPAQHGDAADGSSGELSVRGGAGGLVADCAAMTAAASTLRRSATGLGEVAGGVALACLREPVALAAALDPAGALAVGRARLTALGPGGLAGTAADAGALALRLELAAHAYAEAERVATQALTSIRDTVALEAGALVASALGPELVAGAAAVGLVTVVGGGAVWAVVRGAPLVGALGDEGLRALADGRVDAVELTALRARAGALPETLAGFAEADARGLGQDLGDEASRLMAAHPVLTQHVVGALPAFVAGALLGPAATAASRRRAREVALPGGDRLVWPPQDVADLAADLAVVATPDGVLRPTRVRLHPRGPAVPVEPARGVADLVALSAPMAGGGALSPGGDPDSAAPVRVEKVTDAAGRRRWVLTLPPTQTTAMPAMPWSAAAGPRNPADLGTDVRAVGQLPSAASRAGVLALRAAGVARGEPVLVTGYSQGGITAMVLACDPEVREEFAISAVLTAGAPVGGFDVPGDVAALSLEHEEDWITALDGADNPADPEHTTVRRDLEAYDPSFAAAVRDDGMAGHAVGRYERTAALVDASREDSLVAWRRAVGPFLAAPGTTSTAQVFDAERLAVP